MSSQIQAADEVRHTNLATRKPILKAAGLNTDASLSTQVGLAMKADLNIPWNKLRHLRSYNNITLAA